jgi:hypothetical protein
VLKVLQFLGTLNFTVIVLTALPLLRTTQRSISQITWLLKGVVVLQVEYIILCKSIKRFDLRCWSRKFARETASPLNLFKISALRFVASVCNSIARCTLSTTFILSAELKNSTEVVPQFLHPLKKGGLLAVV